MAELTPKIIIEALPSIFQPQHAKGMTCTIQLHLTGDMGGFWIINIADGMCTTSEGKAEKPTSTLITSAQNYIALAEGDLSPMVAVMTRQAQVKGDPIPLMKMEKFFKRPKKGTY